jgi:adenosylhomocysteine nucleosidase
LDSRPVLVVGLVAETRITRRLGWPTVIGGGTYEGALAASERAARDQPAALISFGLAAGLDPALRPGAVLAPDDVLVAGERIPTDPTLRVQFGCMAGGTLIGVTDVVATASAKQALFNATGARAADVESGAVALVARERCIPFAVLRAICDPAVRDLPSAALGGLDRHGAISITHVLGSLIRDPWQISALLALAADARAAQRALRDIIASYSGGSRSSARHRRGIDGRLKAGHSG